MDEIKKKIRDLKKSGKDAELIAVLREACTDALKPGPNTLDPGYIHEHLREDEDCLQILEEIEAWKEMTDPCPCGCGYGTSTTIKRVQPPEDKTDREAMDAFVNDMTLHCFKKFKSKEDEYRREAIGITRRSRNRRVRRR